LPTFGIDVRGGRRNTNAQTGTLASQFDRSECLRLASTTLPVHELTELGQLCIKDKFAIALQKFASLMRSSNVRGYFRQHPLPPCSLVIVGLAESGCSVAKAADRFTAMHAGSMYNMYTDRRARAKPRMTPQPSLRRTATQYPSGGMWAGEGTGEVVRWQRLPGGCV